MTSDQNLDQEIPESNVMRNSSNKATEEIVSDDTEDWLDPPAKNVMRINSEVEYFLSNPIGK